MRRIRELFLAAVGLAAVVWMLWPARSAGVAPGATAPSTSPTTASAPADRWVRWRPEYGAAAAEAAKRKIPLVVVYFDPDAPAWELFDEHTLQDGRTRRLLGKFAAAKLDVTTAEAKTRFLASGHKQTPLTQVFTPAGELLDSIPGAVMPAEKFLERLRQSLAYWRAATAKPFDSAKRWRAIQLRLKLSTRAEAVPDIEKLMKLPQRQLPADVTGAHLLLAKGRALFLAAPEQADRLLREARKLAPRKGILSGQVLMSLIELATSSHQYGKAHRYCAEYIRDFPAGTDIGRAYYCKAVVEATGLDDRSAALATLKKFMGAYPGNPEVVSARKLLESLEKMGSK